LVALALFAAGCGSASLAPKSGGSATIEGNVAGSSQALRVEVPGTAVSTTTDANGAFLLTDVPEGSAFLRFSGGGNDATLAIQALVSSEYRRITVSVSGNQCQEHSEQTESEFKGPVTAISGQTLTVEGRQVSVTDQTKIVKGGVAAALADITVGTPVEVRGSLQADGTVVALFIGIGGGDDHNPGPGDDGVALAGAIKSIDGTKLNVGGLTVNLTSTTEIFAGDATVDASTLKVGDLVLVRGAVQADSSITATTVRVLLPPPGDGDWHVAGIVTAVSPADNTFTIGDTKITVDANTTYGGGSLHSLADLKVGDKAEAEVVKQTDGSLLAKEVHVFIAPPPPPPPGVEVRGNIDAVGAESVTIAGKVFAVDGHTQIRRGEATIAITGLNVGEPAVAKGTFDASGKLIADIILVAPPPPPPGDVEVTGNVDAVGLDGITVAGKRFIVNAATAITIGTTAGHLADIKVGETAEATGTTDASGKLVATAIHVEAH
jgi:hypothetical protein